MILEREYSFEAAHHLPEMPEGHKCKRLHGHSYKVRVGVSGPIGANGLVMEFGEIDAVAEVIVMGLDHQLLNDVIPNPTIENLVTWLMTEIGDRLPLAYVEASETPNSTCRLER